MMDLSEPPFPSCEKRGAICRRSGQELSVLLSVRVECTQPLPVCVAFKIKKERHPE